MPSQAAALPQHRDNNGVLLNRRIQLVARSSAKSRRRCIAPAAKRLRAGGRLLVPSAVLRVRQARAVLRAAGLRGQPFLGGSI